MYILPDRGFGDVPQYTPWRSRLNLNSQPQHLRFLNLDKFGLNEFSLTPAHTQMLKHLAKHVQVSWKTMHPIGIIRLIGHTDNTGNHNYNVKLGNQRALAVKEVLEKLLKEDILKRRVVILVDESPGELKWVADNRSPKGKALNRRVEVFIKGTPAPTSPIIPPDPPPPSQSSVMQNSKNNFDSCSDTQKKFIEGAFVSALRSINYAERVLATAYGRPDRVTQRTKYLLNSHFHTTRRDDVLKIYRNILNIRQALEKGLNIKCMRRCDGSLSNFCGYAYAKQWFGGFDPIHICFDDRPNHCNFANQFSLYQQALIIHEAAHRYVGIDDKAYMWKNFAINSKYSKLTSRQAMDNADSYAWFCVELSFLLQP